LEQTAQTIARTQIEAALISALGQVTATSASEAQAEDTHAAYEAITRVGVEDIRAAYEAAARMEVALAINAAYEAIALEETTAAAHAAAEAIARAETRPRRPDRTDRCHGSGEQSSAVASTMRRIEVRAANASVRLGETRQPAPHHSPPQRRARSPVQCGSLPPANCRYA
jgi:hypothetical protein